MSVVFPINPDDRVETYTASAGQTVFSVPFPFQDNRDVVIEKIALDGSVTTLAEGVHYALIGAGGIGGGAFTLSSPAAAGEKFRPIGRAVLDRLTSVVRAGKFASKPTDDELDRNRIIQQEQARDIARALKVDYGAPQQILPPADDGTALGWLEGRLVNIAVVDLPGEAVAGSVGLALLASASGATALGALGIPTAGLTFFAESADDVRAANLGPGYAFAVVRNGAGAASVYAYKPGTDEADTGADVIISKDGRRYVRSVAGVTPGALGQSLVAATCNLDVDTLLGRVNRRYDYPSAGTYVMNPLGFGDRAVHYAFNASGTVTIDVAGLIPYETYTLYTSRTATVVLDCGEGIAFNGSLTPASVVAPTAITILPNHKVTICKVGGATLHVTVDALDDAWTVNGPSRYRRSSDGTYEFIYTRPAASSISAGAISTSNTIVSGYDLSTAKVLACTMQPKADGTMGLASPCQVAKLGTTHGLAANAFGIGNPNASATGCDIVVHLVGVIKT